MDRYNLTLVAILLSASPVCGEEVGATMSLGEWSAFKDDVACWAATETKPNTTTKPKLKDTSVVAYVSFKVAAFTPSLFRYGVQAADDMYVSIGTVKFDLYADGSTLFTNDEDTPLLLELLRHKKIMVGNANTMLSSALRGFLIYITMSPGYVISTRIISRSKDRDHLKSNSPSPRY